MDANLAIKNSHQKMSYDILIWSDIYLRDRRCVLQGTESFKVLLVYFWKSHLINKIHCAKEKYNS